MPALYDRKTKSYFSNTAQVSFLLCFVCLYYENVFLYYDFIPLTPQDRILVVHIAYYSKV